MLEVWVFLSMGLAWMRLSFGSWLRSRMYLGLHVLLLLRSRLCRVVCLLLRLCLSRLWCRPRLHGIVSLLGRFRSPLLRLWMRLLLRLNLSGVAWSLLGFRSLLLGLWGWS